MERTCFFVAMRMTTMNIIWMMARYDDDDYGRRLFRAMCHDVSA